jgi:hypothetical protein
MKTLGLAIGFLCFVGFAQAESSASSKNPPSKTYKEKTTIDFEAAVVDGQFQTPDGSAVKGDSNVGFDSMLEPRKSFSDQMMRFSGAVR